MSNLSRIEIIILLCHYYIDKGKNVDSFTNRYNQYFKKDVSSQTVLYCLTRFKNVNPSNNVTFNPDNMEYKEVWDEYVKGDKISELKEIYRDFKKGVFISTVDILNDEKGSLVDISIGITLDIKDIPQERPVDYKINGFCAYKRNKEVVANALAYADYLCELGCDTDLFKRRGGKVNYTEAHHLIPLCFQDEFSYSLDVESNIVSLCPNCHRKLHYGLGVENDLRKLYDKRMKRLSECGINISFEKLLLLYR